MLREMPREIKQDMQDYLPKYYADSKIVQHLLVQESDEIMEYHKKVRDLLNQFFVETATWGLSRWEAICGIPVLESKPEDQRRSLIKSKLRGSGTVTVPVIKSVVDSFENGQIDVQENFEKYEVVITFIGTRGIPANLDDVKAAVREIVPAHLGINYQFTYLRWEELDEAKLTWEQLEAMNKNWNQLEVWKPKKGV
ncbi:YmfQ family protein [Paenibacillus tuaregi]|uniref:YmfQ family protein n=1 Tax=Paenibacillus tuaregi TaxID=1816681 RepID=UPI001F2EC5CE|nr:YmfQ family protein [Paenibacillus tuaregi]